MAYLSNKCENNKTTRTTELGENITEFTDTYQSFPDNSPYNDNGNKLTTIIYTKKSMHHLKSMAETLSASNKPRLEDTKLPTHLNDEVGLLARAFEKKTKMLNKLALYDSLTGLPNRKNFLDHLDEAILRAKRSHSSLAVVYLDINHFKDVNDNYGHDYGDNLLVTFASKLKSVIRESDICARLSGDEFAVIAENIKGPAELDKMLHRYSEALNQTYSIKGVALNVSISGGVSVFPEDSMDAKALLHQADTAMYHSKKDRAGKICLYSKVKE